MKNSYFSSPLGEMPKAEGVMNNSYFSSPLGEMPKAEGVMKNLIVIIFVLFIKLSMAQNPAEKAVIVVPVHQQPGFEQMPLEYNTQTTRLVQVLEAPQPKLKLPASSDSLIGLLAGANTLNAQYQLALLYLNRGEYTQGSNVLSNVPIHFALSTEELTTHQNMVDYYNWLVAVEQDNGNLLYPDSTQQQQLWDIALSDSSGAGVYARNLLVSLDETTYNEPIILPDMYKSTRAMEDYDKLLHTDVPNFLKLFPNPTKDYVILEYILETNVTASILIQDIKGNTIHSLDIMNQQDQVTVITHDWKPGLYIAGLYVNGRLIESAKFTVLNQKKGNN